MWRGGLLPDSRFLSSAHVIPLQAPHVKWHVYAEHAYLINNGGCWRESWIAADAQKVASKATYKFRPILCYYSQGSKVSASKVGIGQEEESGRGTMRRGKGKRNREANVSLSNELPGTFQSFSLSLLTN